MTEPAAAPAILFADDEAATRNSVEWTLRSQGFEHVLTASDGEEALHLLRERPVALLLLDLNMPGRGGEEVLAEVMANWPHVPVVVITAVQEVSTAVRCMKLGADDYLIKPVEPEQLKATVERTLEHGALRWENLRLREQFLASELEKPDSCADLVGSDPAMLRLFAYLEAVSRASHPVLITGETGTGKELVARALHKASGRSGPFVAVDVAGLDDVMFSDTLFGHRSGAYTGATGSRRGLVEEAGNGTLFLDEIGDLEKGSQVKLLRLLQEREYRPLGSDQTRKLAARVVTATHRDPSTLRQDLYYRLRAYRIRVPPLRERLSDLPALVDHFLGLAARDLGKDRASLPGSLLAALTSYDFPGNVRELQSIVFEAVMHQESGLTADDLLARLRGPLRHGKPTSADDGIVFPYPLPTLREIDRAAIGEALRRVGGDRPAAARMLDVLHLDAAGSDADTAHLEEKILTREELAILERDNLIAALHRTEWQVKGRGGAAELLDMKPSTLISRMKTLGIRKPEGE